jgi:HNH endonuclease
MMNRCIWCQQSPFGHHVEHVIPEALGGPPGLGLTSAVICVDCNNGLGHLDQAVCDEFDFSAFMARVPRKKVLSRRTQSWQCRGIHCREWPYPADQHGVRPGYRTHGPNDCAVPRLHAKHSSPVVTAGPKMETPPVRECESMGAPRIRTPIAGTNNEIGDGSGTTIVLSRGLAAGERLLVTQEVGECKSRTGYRISVHNPR